MYPLHSLRLLSRRNRRSIKITSEPPDPESFNPIKIMPRNWHNWIPGSKNSSGQEVIKFNKTKQSAHPTDWLTRPRPQPNRHYGSNLSPIICGDWSKEHDAVLWKMICCDVNQSHWLWRCVKESHPLLVKTVVRSQSFVWCSTLSN